MILLSVFYIIVYICIAICSISIENRISIAFNLRFKFSLILNKIIDMINNGVHLRFDNDIDLMFLNLHIAKLSIEFPIIFLNK